MASSLDTQVITAPQNEPVFIGDTLVTPTGGAQGTLADKLAGGGGATGATGATGAGGATGPTGSGGGGGGSSITLTAGTDLAAGTAVAINSSGDAVQTWGPAPNIPGVVTLIPNTAVANTNENLSASINLQDSTHFLGWVNADTAIVVAASVSGTIITVGTPVAAPADTTIYDLATLSDALFVGLGNASPAAVFAASISALAITVGAAANTDVNGNAGIVALNSTTFVVAGAASGPNIQAGTVSGTTITLGAAINVGSQNLGNAQLAALSSSLFVLAYNDAANDQNLTVVAGTVSGTTVTLGTPVVVADTTVSANPAIAALSATSFVVLFPNGPGAAGSLAQAVVGTVATRTVTLGTPVIVAQSYEPSDLGANGVQIPRPSIAVIDSTHVAFGAGPALPQVYTVSGTTLSAGAISTVSNALARANSLGNGLQINSVVAAGSELVVVDGLSSVFEIGQSGGAVSPYFEHGNLVNYGLSPLTSSTVLAWFQDLSTNLQARVITVEPISPGGPVGFVASSVTDGDPATVNISGITGGFTGLTTGTEYFVSGDGTITTANTGHPAGVAVSSTEILIA